MKQKLYPPSRKRAAFLRAGFLLLALWGLLMLLDARVAPIIRDVAAYQAKIASMRYINDAMAAAISEDPVAYGDIVSLSWNDLGQVSAIQTDTAKINRMKVAVTDSVLRAVQDTGNQTILIPLGTLSGVQMLSGRGPVVEIRAIPTGYVQTKVSNRFESAGINQTLHQILLETGVSFVITLPGYSVKAETVTSYCVAETVIVGSIPDGYTYVGDDDRSLLSKIYDYPP
ncbi:sporulation protein YunB [Ruminococcaceae bacterium OttesenSCG-928-L11]|nr:sporulation protein YunB [Ruminococcaceae bacterium OttesenSCG-928-L11]